MRGDYEAAAKEAAEKVDLPRMAGAKARVFRLSSISARATGGCYETASSGSKHLLTPAQAGWRGLIMQCTPVWRLGLSYAARSSGLERFDYAVHPSLATGAILCRPLKRAGEVWLCSAPQSDDWGYPMPPASAGWRGLVMVCTPVWRLGLSYAARSSGLERFGYAVHPSLATGAILCRPLKRAGEV